MPTDHSAYFYLRVLRASGFICVEIFLLDISGG